MSEYKDKDKDTNSKQSGEKADAPVNLGHHESQCTICRHVDRQAIEEKWIDWGCTASIAKEYGVSRDSIYRHARATGLFAKRQANFKVIFEKVLERRDPTLFTGSNYISMLNAYIKIILAENAAEAVQSADEKPAAHGTTAKESDNGALAGSNAEMLDEMSSAELGKGQNEQKEPQGPEPTTVQ